MKAVDITDEHIEALAMVSLESVARWIPSDVKLTEQQIAQRRMRLKLARLEHYLLDAQSDAIEGDFNTIKEIGNGKGNIESEQKP